MASLASRLSLRQLRYFAAVVEAHSFTAAAASLHVAQPALSRQIGQLEAGLGEPLLLRGAGGVQATAAGRRLYQLARETLERIDGAEAELKGRARQPRGRVSVALPSLCGIQFVAELVRSCQARLPEVELQVIDGLAPRTGHALETGMADFGIVPNADELGGVQAEALFREQLFLVRSRQGRRRYAPEVGLAELAQVPLVLGPHATHMRRSVEGAARTAGLGLDVRYEQHSTSTIASFVLAGVAATISNSPALVDHFAPDAVAVQRIVRPHLWRTISIAHPSVRPLNHAASAVYAVVRELALARVADKSWRADV